MRTNVTMLKNKCKTLRKVIVSLEEEQLKYDENSYDYRALEEQKQKTIKQLEECRDSAITDLMIQLHDIWDSEQYLNMCTRKGYITAFSFKSESGNEYALNIIKFLDDDNEEALG